MIDWKQGSTLRGVISVIECIALGIAGWNANMEQIVAIVAAGEAVKGILGITKEG